MGASKGLASLRNGFCKSLVSLMGYLTFFYDPLSRERAKTLVRLRIDAFLHLHLFYIFTPVNRFASH